MIHLVRKNKSLLLFVSLFMVLVNCAHGIDTLNDVDAGTISEDSSLPCYPPVNATDDWCTSGNFNGPCSPKYSDNTKNGHCTCGQSNFQCGLGSNCRFGVCIKVDITGDICEFDGYQTGSRTGDGGDCDDGYLCVEGHCTFYECTPEKCDGIDNDCDGDVDEAEDGMPLRQFCLGDQPSPPTINPPCEIGRRECIDGAWTECIDDISPRPEQGLLACNLIDDDCDTCVDGVLQENGTCTHTEPGIFDVIFLMDISGSMSTTIHDVITAVNNFAANFSNNPSFRFGIVLVSPSGAVGGQGLIYLDLTDFNTFAAALAAMPVSGGGEEPQWDIIYELATGELQLSWADNSTRILILFTDEPGQTTRIERGLPPVHEEDACASLQHGEVWASFTDPTDASDFDDCSLRFDISDSATMENTLETQILVNPCE